jgi:hypothetical protein
MMPAGCGGAPFEFVRSRAFGYDIGGRHPQTRPDAKDARQGAFSAI